MKKLTGFPTITCFLSLMLLSFIPFAQNKIPNCTDLKDGIFYFYPKNTSELDLNIREGELLREINTKTGDTILWKIQWPGDCQYTLKYISGDTKMSDEHLKFFKKHKLIYEIERITSAYYTFKGYVDKVSDTPLQSDTMWLNEKVNRVNNELFKPVENSAVLKKAHFNDTSKYAVLFVYRPKKLANSLGNYILYFDDNIMCVAKNNSGYIFKVLREGQFVIKSKLYKDESAIKLDVKFGKTYYVKSMIHWGITSRLYNFKLEMSQVSTADGKSEFEEVDLQ
ncbi:MAG: hypothetical protein JWP81_3190 [Ferruginibacter sp.]|nr:hypothetical protein [Ferruginibacter sp.]